MLSQTEILLRNALDEQLKEYFDEAMRGIPWFLQKSCQLKHKEQDAISSAREIMVREKKRNHVIRLSQTLRLDSGFES